MDLNRTIVVASAIAIGALLSACDGKVESEFVAGCTSQGATKSKCTCLYSKLKDKYGEEGLEAMQEGKTVLPGFLEANVVGAAQCSGVDPSVALREMGIEPASRAPAQAVIGEPAAPQSEPGEAPSTDGRAAASGAADADQAADAAVIASAVAAMASSEGGEEYKDARHSVAGDLNGDGVSDVAVLFTVEISATNTSTQHLSAFLRQADGTLQFADTASVGSTGGDAINGVAIDAGSIKVKTLTRGPDDPDCCPSVEGSVEYLLHNGKLKRVG